MNVAVGVCSSRLHLLCGFGEDLHLTASCNQQQQQDLRSRVKKKMLSVFSAESQTVGLGLCQVFLPVTDSVSDDVCAVFGGGGGGGGAGLSRSFVQTVLALLASSDCDLCHALGLSVTRHSLQI